MSGLAGCAYNAEQIAEYARYVGLPSQFHLSAQPNQDPSLLTSLFKCQLAAIPYDNLSLHYSSNHDISLDPQVLFQKFVSEKRGRGGYCMENSIFFNHILRAFGFDAYMSGARIRLRRNGVPCGDFVGWVHIVNIVTLSDGSVYMLDVGFGGDGPIAPMPMIPGYTIQNIGTQELRLIYDNIEQQVNKRQKLWIVQYRNGKDRDWNSYYTFPELEFLEADFEVMNFFTAKNPVPHFPSGIVLIIRFLRRDNEEGEPEIYGKVMLVNGEIKQNLGGKTVVVKVCTSEEERVDAIKTYFAISLNDDEIQGIKGWKTELTGRPT